jgi:hypothetical protein
MLISSVALLGAAVGPWLVELPPPEATGFFKDSLAEPSSQVLMLIGCGTLVAFGLVKRLRDGRKAAGLSTTYSAPARRAA